MIWPKVQRWTDGHANKPSKSKTSLGFHSMTRKKKNHLFVNETFSNSAGYFWNHLSDKPITTVVVHRAIAVRVNVVRAKLSAPTSWKCLPLVEGQNVTLYSKYNSCVTPQIFNTSVDLVTGPQGYMMIMQGLASIIIEHNRVPYQASRVKHYSCYRQ